MPFNLQLTALFEGRTLSPSELRADDDNEDNKDERMRFSLVETKMLPAFLRVLYLEISNEY